MDELDTSAQQQQRIKPYPTSLGDLRDDLKKQILMNHTGSRLSYNQIPLVHGRSVGARLESSSQVNGGSAGTVNKGSAPVANGRPAGGRTRMANHQRNLSLDFRSMGIVLPPVSQVTNTRVNLTQHHRNRSLDSALQGIPEVEVSSPSAELEKTICTNSLYGATMCSKISTSLYNSHKPNQKNLIGSGSSSSSGSGDDDEGTAEQGEGAVAAATITTIAAKNNELSQQQKQNSGDSGVQSSSPTASKTMMMMDSSGSVTSPVPAMVVPNSNNSSNSGVVVNKSSSLMMKKKSTDGSGKKRDDLTCLGSDDSGIICNSEHENHHHATSCRGSTGGGGVGHSRDSISSTGDDMIVETEDEMFSQNEGDEDEHRIMSRTPSEEADEEEETRRTREQFSTFLVKNSRSRFNGDEGAKEEARPVEDVTNTNSAEAPFSSGHVLPTAAGRTTATMGNGIKSHKHHEQAEVTHNHTIGGSSGKDHKNDVMFKNFFGATKNAIFRTAQSIIDNHEKKNSSKKLSIDLPQTPGDGEENALASPTGNEKASNSSSSSHAANPSSLNVLGANSSGSSPSPTGETAPPVIVPTKKREFFMLKPKIPGFHLSGPNKSQQATTAESEKKKLPGSVRQCVIKEEEAVTVTSTPAITITTTSSSVAANGKLQKTPAPPTNNNNSRPTKADHNGLLRFFESPIFNIHFAVHYLFYSKEPGVLMFIANKIFSFPDDEVDLYMPQLVLMYTQMDELAEILDSYLVYRCRKSVDFSLKCAWLLEAYNMNVNDTVKFTGGLAHKMSRLYLLKELYPKRERKFHQQMGVNQILQVPDVQSPIKKTHHRSQSDATGLFGGSGGVPGGVGGGVAPEEGRLRLATVSYPPKPLALGDLTTGRAFDNGCLCFVTVRGTVNDLRGQKTVCSCGAPKLLPEREFMKLLIEIGRTLTSLPTKSEKTTALRMFLNLINKNLPARVWLPLHSEIPHHVVRITEDKTAILNSKDKTPYIIYVEVVEVNDIYTSPVMPKLMPTLRHTKSEEHLESGGVPAQGEKKPQEAGKVATCNLLRPEDQGTTTTEDQHEKLSNRSSSENGFDLRVREDDVWSQEDDEITAQYIQMQKLVDRDAVSQLSMDSCDSKDQGAPVLFNIRDVRNRHCVNLNTENTKTFSNDPEDPSAAALKEPWDDKEKQIRMSSPYGHLPNWKLLSVIVKSGDDLRQELMATQLLQMFRLIWEEESVGLWVRPYKIVCLSNDSGLIEPILNTVSIHQIKKNSNKSLKEYFVDEYGDQEGDRFQEAQRKFMQSCAAYCLISYLLQVKDRHNGNILLHADGHLIHIDFGFILNISPKNLGFEQSPFKLTPEFVDVMGGPESELWLEFKHLLLKGLLAARKHMERIINIVEIMRSSSQLPCFKNGCSTTVRNLRNRFHMGLTEQELERKVEQLIQDSLNSLSTKLYDGYQYYTNGIL